MTASSENVGAPPLSATEAVLGQSNGMPEGSQRVEELDFNQFAGRAITVDDLISGMNHMGFQASAVGEAVRIINDMVALLFAPSTLIANLTSHSAPGEIPRRLIKPQYS
jgi:deoxyhypusine synthase